MKPPTEMTREQFMEAQKVLGFSIPQIADFLGISEHTVKKYRYTGPNQNPVPNPAARLIRREMKDRGLE